MCQSGWRQVIFCHLAVWNIFHKVAKQRTFNSSMFVQTNTFFQEIHVWYLLIVSSFSTCKLHKRGCCIWGPHHAHTLTKLHSQDPSGIIVRKNWVSISGYAACGQRVSRTPHVQKPEGHALQTFLDFQQASLPQALTAQLPIFTPFQGLDSKHCQLERDWFYLIFYHHRKAHRVGHFEPRRLEWT